MMPPMTSSLGSGRVAAVLERLRTRARIEDPQARQRVREREAELGARLGPAQRYALYGDAPLAIAPEVGELYYALVMARRAGGIVEFGASHGMSTIYLACALRDLAGGTLITTEIVPDKAEATRSNLVEAGLDDLGTDDPDLQAYQRHLRRPGGGYHSTTLPLDAGLELSVRIGS
jgi:predicted O-methyltransferase YrrM